MTVKDALKHPMTWLGTVVTGSIIAAVALVSTKSRPDLEQRVNEKQGFYIEFHTPENYGMGLAVIEALEKEYGKKFTQGTKLYFAEIYINKDRANGISPEELSDYINGKKADGTERTWAKNLKPVKTTKTGLPYTFSVDSDPTQEVRLTALIAEHASIREVPYTTEHDREMWRYHAKKWVAETFGKDNYINKQAVDKYEAHIRKIKEALK
ncbi:MAG: hypothetical protein QW165_01765 [Candidatus Woesearchaeota archaeon]